MPTEPDRVWRLQGARNFRDLGGYRGHGGRPLRWRRLLRSDRLAGLTAADIEALRPLGLERALDFRGTHERAQDPYHLPGTSQHALSIEPTVMDRLQQHVEAGREPDAELTAELMRELYRELVNERADRFAAFFEHLLQSRGAVVFHCTAGKDRTGVAAALLLLALGVSREQVMHDYLLTNELIAPAEAGGPSMRSQSQAVLWSVQRGFLDEALQAIDRDHGGIERYLAQRLGLGPAAIGRLRERYLAGDDEA